MAEKYKPEQGDEVEVVLRGKVTCSYTTYAGFEIGAHIIHTKRDEVVSVKKIRPRLPVAPNSVVRVGLDDIHYLLGYDRHWRGPSGHPIEPVILSGFDFEIVCDAGKKEND